MAPETCVQADHRSRVHWQSRKYRSGMTLRAWKGQGAQVSGRYAQANRSMATTGAAVTAERNVVRQRMQGHNG